MSVRGFTAALNSAGKYPYKPPESVVDYLVVGGGVVGLAVARLLAQRCANKTTFLVERHPRGGEETSSRNSEVIHAGLYYPTSSYKTRLCLRGRQLMYAHCEANGVPFRRAGKLVVATADQHLYIESLHRKAQLLEPPPRWPAEEPVLPTELITGDQARALEPSLSQDIAGALWSPMTGIVDSHSFIESLEKDIIESDGAELAYSTRVPDLDEDGWVVQSVTGDTPEGDAVLARVLINASGLAAPLTLNSLRPESKRFPMYFARGSYASYRGPGISGVSHLLYPCPDTTKGKDNHSFQSLGTHLTLDLQGKVRFGPDLDWISPPTNDESESDFWTKYLVPDESRLEMMHKAVTKYLPSVQLDGLQPDYVGIRPKLVGPGGGFKDFVFRSDYSGDFVTTKRSRGGQMVSLLGIESPGLTASLAIAEMVVDEMVLWDGLGSQ
ncbi:FAD dependent oxidoreductase [Auriscalpium vulgare]|uniref:FAD dependent oxidoreductase n=1 Tax=Auriscalpium vulgare TaxID=40419 RepID=A0ACB8S8Z1_9AGAM|nr:FAD dependent oxidoreductase [Auriscalpium vulgare]